MAAVSYDASKKNRTAMIIDSITLDYSMIQPPRVEPPPPQPDKDSPEFWDWFGKCVKPPTDWAAIAEQMTEIANTAKERGLTILLTNHTR